MKALGYMAAWAAWVIVVCVPLWAATGPGYALAWAAAGPLIAAVALRIPTAP